MTDEIKETAEPKKRGRKAKPKFDVICSEDEKAFILRYIKKEWIDSLANQYGIEKFEYIHKFRAFRVYVKGRHVDWVSLNDLMMLNGKQPEVTEKLKYAAIPPSRQLIKMAWRK